MCWQPDFSFMVIVSLGMGNLNHQVLQGWQPYFNSEILKKDNNALPNGL
jgi:hypothetical protein